MGATRKSYTPKYRHDAAHLVIDTGRTITEVAAEIGVGAGLLGRWVAVERSRMEDPLRRSMPTSGPSWCGYAARSSSCEWTGSS